MPPGPVVGPYGALVPASDWYVSVGSAADVWECPPVYGRLPLLREVMVLRAAQPRLRFAVSERLVVPLVLIALVLQLACKITLSCEVKFVRILTWCVRMLRIGRTQV